MSVYLKVKICSLAAEARIIRKLEKSRLAYVRNKQESVGESDLPAAEEFRNLRQHRMAFRYDMRHTFLAYAFLRGRNYRNVEAAGGDNDPRPRVVPNWHKVAAMVIKYGPPRPAPKKAELTQNQELIAELKEWAKQPAKPLSEARQKRNAEKKELREREAARTRDRRRDYVHYDHTKPPVSLPASMDARSDIKRVHAGIGHDAGIA